MKNLVWALAAICALLFSSAANAQCVGIFGANQFCGTIGAGPPGPQSLAVIGSIVQNPRIMAQLSWAPGAISAQTCGHSTFVVTGVRPNVDVVVLQVPTNLEVDLMPRAIIPGSDLVEIIVCNPTSGTVTQSSGGPYTVLIP